MIQDGTLYWITGLSGAGKTTIGNRLYYEIKKLKANVILLDGDVLKNAISDNGDNDQYSDMARRNRALKYAKICKMLTDQGCIVICCTIAMYDYVRAWNRSHNKRYVEVFLDVPMNVLEIRDQKGMYSDTKRGGGQTLAGVNLEVEFPQNPDVTIINDGRFTIEQCASMIISVDASLSSDYDRDKDYWNNYYCNSNDEIAQPSLFAKDISQYLSEGKNLLELGCGNGRDSLYFDSLGLNVTAIDASDKAIKELNGHDGISGNTYFLCDDFVTAVALYVGQYDYVYSRFSLHAIKEQQESEVIKSVFCALKTGGLFFIEVRSVNDELYGLGRKVAEDSYFYQGHFRRFVRKERLEEKLRNTGFEIEYSEDKRGFAPFGEDDPIVIRIIAKK